jgi:hypothetical protein
MLDFVKFAKMELELRYRTFYIKIQNTRWRTAEQARTIQKDSGRKGGGGEAELLEDKNQLEQAILDCTSKNVYTIITNNQNDLKAIERDSQNLCFELHRLRTKLYCELK